MLIQRLEYREGWTGVTETVPQFHNFGRKFFESFYLKITELYHAVYRFFRIRVPVHYVYSDFSASLLA